MTDERTGPVDIPLPRLYERDIDVLLAEELIFNRELVRVLADALGAPPPMKVRRCDLSVVDASGETDVLVEVLVGDETGLILLENKIDAAFQPRQPERYRERAESLLSSSRCNRAFTALIAPQDYLTRAEGESAHFDAALSYQKIAEVMRGFGGERGAYRAGLLLRAVDSARRAYRLVPDDEVTTFWRRVYAIATREFPGLEMFAPGPKGSASSWFVFKGGLPKRITVDWKAARGLVDLTIWNGEAATSNLIDAARSAGLHDVQLAERGEKAKAISITLPPRAGHFTEIGDDAIRSALWTADCLRGVYLTYLDNCSQNARL